MSLLLKKIKNRTSYRDNMNQGGRYMLEFTALLYQDRKAEFLNIFILPKLTEMQA